MKPFFRLQLQDFLYLMIFLVLPKDYEVGNYEHMAVKKEIYFLNYADKTGNLQLSTFS